MPRHAARLEKEGRGVAPPANGRAPAAARANWQVVQLPLLCPSILTFAIIPVMIDPQEETIRHILTTYRAVAAVGFSDRDRTKAFYYVPAYLKGQGYTVIPVNPRLEVGLGRQAYRSLLDIRESVEVALLYVPARRVGETVDQAIAIGAKAVWMTLGMVDEAAARRARAAGLWVVMDRCMMVEHKYLE
mgnify:CR=1 FL=1